MTILSPKNHANAGRAKADILVRKAIGYLKAPTEESDQKRDYRELIDKGAELLRSLHLSLDWRGSASSIRPESRLIGLLRDVDQFAVEVLGRTEESGIQAVQVELRQHISGALGVEPT